MVGNSWTVLKVILGHKYHNCLMRSKSTDHSQNLKQKVCVFLTFFIFVLCQHHRLQTVNKADEVLLGKQPREQGMAIKIPRKMYGEKKCNLRMLSREYNCLANIGT